MGGDGMKFAAPTKPLISKISILFITPLIVVFVLVAVMGSKSFDWELRFQSPSMSGLDSDKSDFVGVSSTPSKSGNDTEVGKEKEERLDSEASTVVFPFVNVSRYNDSFIDGMEILRRDYSELDMVEAGLQMARVAIRDAMVGNESHVEDSDYVPNGPMYWNSNSFHRSYLEMEKRFKVHIYREGEPPLFHTGPGRSIYSMEGNFIHSLEQEQMFRTKDPRKAHVFFLPFSVTMMVSYVHETGSRSFDPLKRTVADYINVIKEKYPYWNRSLGADHFMLSCHDWGPEVSKAVPELFNNSIRVLCNANTSEGFVPSKDASIPEINLVTGNAEELIGGLSPSKRTVLAFFAGGLHGPIRPILLQHWQNKDPDIQVHQYLPKHMSYHKMMKNSKFCLCPSGYEVASPRIVEALYAGCVPVLISSGYIPPFSDVLNWKEFSVIVPVEEIGNLKEILTRISSRKYIRLQKRGVQVRRHFVVNFPPKRYDVYHMILHSIWLRRLNVRIHDRSRVRKVR